MTCPFQSPNCTLRNTLKSVKVEPRFEIDKTVFELTPINDVQPAFIISVTVSVMPPHGQTTPDTDRTANRNQTAAMEQDLISPAAHKIIKFDGFKSQKSSTHAKRTGSEKETRRDWADN